MRIRDGAFTFTTFRNHERRTTVICARVEISALVAIPDETIRALETDDPDGATILRGKCGTALMDAIRNNPEMYVCAPGEDIVRVETPELLTTHEATR